MLSVEAEEAPTCVMTFNASDPSGAGGLTADIMAIASAGGHALAVVTGAYVRDTADIFDHVSFDEEAVSEQARTALEDMTVSAIKVGFVGSCSNVCGNLIPVLYLVLELPQLEPLQVQVLL